MCLPKCGITDYPSMPKPVTLQLCAVSKSVLTAGRTMKASKAWFSYSHKLQFGQWKCSILNDNLLTTGQQPTNNQPKTNQQPNDNWPTTNQQPTENQTTTDLQPTNRKPNDNWPTTNQQPTENQTTTDLQPTNNQPTTKRQLTYNQPTTNRQILTVSLPSGPPEFYTFSYCAWLSKCFIKQLSLFCSCLDQATRFRRCTCAIWIRFLLMNLLHFF